MLTTPSFEYLLLSPMLIILAAAVVGVLAEAFLDRNHLPVIQLFISVGAILLALIQIYRIKSSSSTSAAIGSVVIDKATIYLQGTILIIGLLALLLISDQEQFVAQASAIPGSREEQESTSKGSIQTEIYPLLSFALAGMMLFTCASDLITLFVALEVFSLPLYLLAGLSRRRRLLSQEAALKYFLLGAYSSAFFLFGAAFLYGISGSVYLVDISSAVSGGYGNDVFVLIGLIFISVGLLFKISAVPFHAWTPDVYQGAPTSVTAFMAAATKVAAFGAILRIFYVVFSPIANQWRPIISVIAIITMVFGSAVAIAQRDVKRMLAYSSIAHAGFILTAVLALNKSGLSAALFYLTTYGLSTLAAFGIITLIRDATGEVTDLNKWAGLGKKSPLIAGSFAFLLLSFAGIPLTSGFIGKFAIFSAAYETGNIAVVVFGVLSSALAAFFYIRVILLMFVAQSQNDSISIAIPSVKSRIAIGATTAATVILGLFPSLLLNLTQSFSIFIK